MRSMSASTCAGSNRSHGMSSSVQRAMARNISPCRALPNPLRLELGVEPVAQRIAEQVEGEDGERDGEAREEDHPRRLAVEIRGVARQHEAPGRLGLGDAEP